MAIEIPGPLPKATRRRILDGASEKGRRENDFQWVFSGYRRLRKGGPTARGSGLQYLRSRHGGTLR